MNIGPKTTWGGQRSGAGRPVLSSTISEYQIRKMLDKAAEYEKKHGQSLDDVILQIAHGSEAPNRERLAAAKLYKDYCMAKLSEGGEADKTITPPIMLPPQKPDPAKIVKLNKDFEE